MKSPGWRYGNWATLLEAVAASWRRWQSPLSRLGEFSQRIFLILGYTYVGIEIDLPIIGDYLPVKNVCLCLAAVLLIGKTVVDTLFYDHYRP